MNKREAEPAGASPGVAGSQVKEDIRRFRTPVAAIPRRPSPRSTRRTDRASAPTRAWGHSAGTHCSDSHLQEARTGQVRFLGVSRRRDHEYWPTCTLDAATLTQTGTWNETYESCI